MCYGLPSIQGSGLVDLVAEEIGILAYIYVLIVHSAPRVFAGATSFVGGQTCAPLKWNNAAPTLHTRCPGRGARGFHGRKNVAGAGALGGREGGGP